jgi:predicted ATPase
MDVPPSVEERKVVTVFFADLVESTALGDGRDPEDVRALLRPLHQRLRTELERHGGVVEKFIGDAVMALFGVPAAREDDAERAVRAALAIRDAIGQLDGDLHVRIGLATGEALIDLAADPRAGEGVAAGDIVNTGFRIAAAAPPDGIFVDETTYYATRDAIAYRPREPAPAKGKAEPVNIWEVEGAREAPAEREWRQFVGRSAELRELREALARVRAERAVGLVTVVGVPGIGKSRLVAELLEETELEVTWLRGRSVPYSEESAFWALAEIVKTYAGIVRADDPESAARKLRAALPAALDPQETDWVEAHAAVLAGVATRAPEGREQAFAAWRRLLEAIAAERPLGLLFEDVHWAGEGLLEFIDHLVGWASRVPLIVVCTTRPELLDRHPAWGRAYERSTVVALGPLREEETLELLAGTLQRVLPEHVEATVVARIEGNPLYAHEYARMLLDRSLLSEASALPLPESVQAVIAARMDTLPREEKALVHDAAVVGRTAWLGPLCALSGLPRYTVEERLAILERKQFVRREPSSTFPGEGSYTFHHVLVRDVAYGQIPRAQRADKHRRVAEWLESASSRREDLAEAIAHHYRCALRLATDAGLDSPELAERTRVALREAAGRALRLNAHAAAAHAYEAALELSPRDGPERAALLLGYGQALARSDLTGAAVLEQAREALVAAGDLEAAAHADVELSDLLRAQGLRDESFDAVRRARDLLAKEPPSAAKAEVLSKLSAFEMFSGRNEEAIRVGFEALQMADELDLPETRAHALNNVGFARATLGDRAGLVDLERSISVASQLRSPEALRGHINLGSVLASLGELGAAYEQYHRGAALAERFGDTRRILWFRAEAIYEAYWGGRWNDALAAVEELLGEHRPLLATEFDARLVRGWVDLGRGDTAGALEDADSVLSFARGGEPQFLLPALALRARVLAASARLREATAAVAEALASWSEGLPSYWLADLAVSATAVGNADELIGTLRARGGESRWSEAARAYGEGRFDDAASTYEAIGSLPDAAFARLRAAEHALSRSDGAGAEARLTAVLDFYREAGATGYVREAEALLAAA